MGWWRENRSFGLVLFLSSLLFLTTCVSHRTLPPSADREDFAVVETRTSPAEAPRVPAGVSVQEGNGWVTVTWSLATDAASHNIYYSTSSSVSKIMALKWLISPAAPIRYVISRIKPRTISSSRR